MLTDEKLNSNYALFIEKIRSTGTNVDNLIAFIGEEKLKNATAAINVESGQAYDGSLINNCLFKIAKYAFLINNQLPKSIQVDQASLLKVCLLHQISKALMFEENDSTWEKTNRGLLYKYVELDGALRCGERSIFICMSNGINFTPEEFEAMRIIDKDIDDNYTKFYSSPISMLVKQANEIANMESRINYKNNN